MKTFWQVATAAEDFAVAQFARCGWDVSVQYGANQPEYDLVAVDGDRVLKISVNGSKDGGWRLTQSIVQNAEEKRRKRYALQARRESPVHRQLRLCQAFGWHDELHQR